MFQMKLPYRALQLLIQSYSAVPVVLVDTRQCIVDVNERFIRLTGSSQGSLEGRELTEFMEIPTSIAKLHEIYFRQSESPEQLPDMRIHTLHGGHSLRHYSIFCVDCKGHRYYGIVMNHFCEAQDLTLLQRFAGTFLRDVNLGVILVDPDFTMVDISDMACKILGFERSKVLNQRMEDVFAAIPNEHQFMQRTILDGVVIRNHAISWTNNQERYELLIDSNLLKDEEGRLMGAYLMFKDVTNLRSLEEQVQRSDRLAMIGQIAAGTAHEIRNPLTSIRGFLQVLKKTFEEKGMSKERGYTDIMLTEITRINELVNEFLLLSKPKHVSFGAVDLSGVIGEILPIINNEAILHNVSVHYEPLSHMPRVVADGELLKQVFLNICKNGIEAMGEGGRLVIAERCNFGDRRVYVDIRDTGPGIPPFLIDKIFDPFFTTKEEGTGLGLSICQRIIHDIGGTIRVSSKGFGTTFTVCIPFSDG